MLWQIELKENRGDSDQTSTFGIQFNNDQYSGMYMYVAEISTGGILLIIGK